MSHTFNYSGTCISCSPWVNMSEERCSMPGKFVLTVLTHGGALCPLNLLRLFNWSKSKGGSKKSHETWADHVFIWLNIIWICWIKMGIMKPLEAEPVNRFTPACSFVSCVHWKQSGSTLCGRSCTAPRRRSCGEPHPRSSSASWRSECWNASLCSRNRNAPWQLLIEST